MKWNFNLKKMLAALLLSCALFIPASGLNGAVFLYEFNVEYSGASEPQGPTPWMTAQFEDTGLNTVQLTISTANLVGSEFASEAYFNFDPSLDVSNLVFTRTSASPPGTTSVSLGADAFKAGPDGFFDILIDFPNSVADGRFEGGQSITFDITTLMGPLDASMFNFPSLVGSNNLGPFFAAAHVQGIGPDGEESGFIGVEVPEPSTYIMLGSMLLVLAFLGRRKVRA